MNYKLFRNHFIFKLPFLKKYDGITLGRWIFLKGNGSKQLISHELIHIQQINYYGMIRFYVSYALYYFAGRVRYKNHNKAYRDNPYEVEAYAKQDNS